MSLEYIYVARHGFRSNWVVNPATGDYTAFIPSPTGIAADPALTAHGVQQARELAAHLRRFGTGGDDGDPDDVAHLPPVDRVYCSPWYRCLQTVQPFVEAGSDRLAGGVRCEPGLGDWFGPAPFVQPQPAPTAELRRDFFPWIDAAYEPAAAAGAPQATPRRHGESMAQLHARVAAALGHVVRQCDGAAVKAVLVCAHAATVIAIGRVLTGAVPADVETEDVGAFTCGLSVYRRRTSTSITNVTDVTTTPAHIPWDDPAGTLAGESWTGGRGLAGGWDCAVNCDCSFLSGGAERGCGDDEAFAGADPPGTRRAIVDAGVELGVVVEGKRGGGEGGGGGQPSQQDHGQQGHDGRGGKDGRRGLSRL